MTRAVVLVALSLGIEQGSIEAAHRSLKSFDPLLRRFGRVRLRRLLHQASRTTSVEDVTHHLRLAYVLCARGTPSADFDDVAGIAAEQSTLAARGRRPWRGPWLVVSLASVGLLLALTAFGVSLWRKPFDPLEGRAGELLGRTLPRLVAGAKGEEAEAAYRDLKRRASERALGSEAGRALFELADATRAVRARPDPDQAARDRFLAASGSLGRALAAGGLPFFVDAELLPREQGVAPLLMSYYVEREVESRIGETRTRTLHVWRLDPLRARIGAVGYARPRTPAALVLLDQLESDLVLFVLPALGDNEPVSLVDLETELRGDAWARDLCQRAGSLVRQSAHGLVKDDGRLGRLGGLLARRRLLVRKWQRNLRAMGIELRTPERLVPEADYVRELELKVPRADLRAWQELHEQSLERDMLDTFLELRLAYADTVERHEVQHRFDFARGMIPVPECVCREIGLADPLDAPEGSLAARSRNELSAYLAELAQGTTPPAIQLVILSHLLFDRDVPPGPYRVVARVILEGLASELGIDVDGVFGRGRSGPAPWVTLLFAVAQRPAEALRKAAASQYRKAFGEELPRVSTLRVLTHTAWRH